MDAAVPLMFWTGYASVVLVSSLYLQEWTVTTSESPKILIFPRRWFDIVGLKMNDVWESALKAVVGVILFRPGISQVCCLLDVLGVVTDFWKAELRWRLRSVYDRQEIHDILCHLWQERFIKSRRDPRIQPIAQDDTTMIVLDDWEEETTFWFIGEGRHWYQI